MSRCPEFASGSGTPDIYSDRRQPKIELEDQGQTIKLLFSGDLGPEEKAFHPEPDAPTGYDYIVCESTYGNRDREDYTLEQTSRSDARRVATRTSRGGNVVIPSFAVERSQELLHDIAVLLDAGEIPNATVYLDSPLARKATEVFIKYASEMEDIEVDESKIFRHPNFRLVESVEESIAINHVSKGRSSFPPVACAPPAASSIT